MYKLYDYFEVENNEDGIILIDTINERMIMLESNEAEILDLLFCLELNEVIERLLSIYEGNQIEEDVIAFVKSLVDKKIIFEI